MDYKNKAFNVVFGGDIKRDIFVIDQNYDTLLYYNFTSLDVFTMLIGEKKITPVDYDMVTEDYNMIFYNLFEDGFNRLILEFYSGR